MATYAIYFVESARKEFERLPVKIRAKIAEALGLLAQNPYSELLKVKKMKGAADLYRIRLGDYRILYELHEGRLVVIVVKIGHRSDVYRR